MTIYTVDEKKKSVHLLAGEITTAASW